MAGFSAEKAIVAGFTVIRRKPAAVAVWAVVYFLLGLLPTCVVYARMLPTLLAQAANPAVTPDPQAIEAMSASMVPWAPALWVLGLLTLSLLYGAVFRAVLTPEDDRFFYLRLGPREMWMALTFVALGIVFVIGLAVVIAVVGMIGHDAPLYATFLAVVAVIFGVVWLMTRLSLSLVMAFAERRFIVVDSWGLTAGHSVKLFGVMLALLVIVVLTEIVLFLPITIGFGLDRHIERLASGGAAALSAEAPWLIAMAVLFSMFGALVYVVLGAPWASIYQQIKGEPPARRLSAGEAVPLD